ncbi:uncharacterized protein [Asterias amurensis]|uniref:uncharacterized protein isoform X2 n=1 Tax=Asterias amurensis TaxID=7602 RepID=UPI003AB2DDFF
MTQMVKATWRRDGAVASGDMSDIFVHDNILGQVFKGISHGDWVNDLTANGESAIHAVRGEMNVVCVQPNRVLQRQAKRQRHSAGRDNSCKGTAIAVAVNFTQY